MRHDKRRGREVSGIRTRQDERRKSDAKSASGKQEKIALKRAKERTKSTGGEKKRKLYCFSVLTVFVSVSFCLCLCVCVCACVCAVSLPSLCLCCVCFLCLR